MHAASVIFPSRTRACRTPPRTDRWPNFATDRGGSHRDGTLAGRPAREESIATRTRRNPPRTANRPRGPHRGRIAARRVRWPPQRGSGRRRVSPHPCGGYTCDTRCMCGDLCSRRSGVRRMSRSSCGRYRHRAAGMLHPAAAATPSEPASKTYASVAAWRG